MAKYGRAQLSVDRAKGTKNINDSLAKSEEGREKQQRRSSGLGMLGKALGFAAGALLPGIGIPLAFAIGGFAGRTVGDLSSNAEDTKVSAGSMSHLFGSEVKDINRELTSFDKNENTSSFLNIGTDLLQGYSLSSAGAGEAFTNKLGSMKGNAFKGAGIGSWVDKPLNVGGL